jgi:hypothetical protein
MILAMKLLTVLFAVVGSSNTTPQLGLPGYKKMKSYEDILSGKALGGDVDDAKAHSLSHNSMDVVSGLLEGFMRRGAKLRPAEKACLNISVLDLAPEIVEESLDIRYEIRKLLTGADPPKERLSSSVPVDSTTKLRLFLTLSAQMIKKCVASSAGNLLQIAGQHFLNATYIAHALVVNGIDIVDVLTDSLVNFEERHFHRFGRNIGTLLRKILLSSTGTVIKDLPEGAPEQEIIDRVMKGVLSGFLAEGSWLNSTETIYPNAQIAFDAHKCSDIDAGFMRTVWYNVWTLFAKLSLNQDKHGLGPLLNITTENLEPGLKEKAEPKWAGELMVALLKFPEALKRCGVANRVQKIFTDAVLSLRYMYAVVRKPDDTVQAQDRMRRAVEDWTNAEYVGFGRQIGLLLRELTMLTFSKKYSIDSAGRLRRKLDSYSVSGESRSISAVLMVSLAFIVALAFVSMQVVWSSGRHADDANSFCSHEDCGMYPLE